MRSEKDKKGGGLMVIYQAGSDIDLRGRIKDKDIRILLAYFSVEHKPEDKQRNYLFIKALTKKIEE